MKPNKFYSVLACLGFSLAAHATDFYVSPTGDDQANGLSAEAAGQSANGPFQTLVRAQSAIKTLKSSGQFSQPVTVHIAAGNYQLSSPLKFDIRDSGVANRQIVWEGQSSANTVISGGIALNNCKPDNAGIWSCPVTGLGLENIRYPNTDKKMGAIPSFNLFVNQQRMTLARWPDTDWAHVKIPADQSTTFSSFEQLPVIEAESAHAQIHIMTSDWFDQYLPVESFDQNLNLIKLSGKTQQGLASGNRFYLQNLLSQLNAPGEWFFDQPNARILFIPPAGVTPQNITVSALQNLLKFNDVSNLTFQNMAFRGTTGDAVDIQKSNNLTLNKLDISNMDSNGIKVNGSTNITISNSHIHDTDAGAYLHGGDRTRLTASNYLIYNNHFDHQSTITLMNPAIAISGVGSRIANNLIEQAPGPGVRIYGNNHIVEKNEIRNVCMQESDCGAIYSGRDWSYRGNIVRYNSIHDIAGYGLQSLDAGKNLVKYGSPAFAVGVYLDDNVSGFQVIGNIFNNIGLRAIQVGGGRDNVIENNVINTNYSAAIYCDARKPNFEALEKDLALVPYKSAVWTGKYPALALPMKNPDLPEGNTIQKNVIIENAANGLPFLYQLPAESTIIANNLVWAVNGSFNVNYVIVDQSKQNFSVPWQKWLELGIEKNSLNADPCATIKGNRVSFCAGSPIHKIGFQALPADIGLIN